MGLPFVEKKVYGGVAYSVFEYTMSEIIASVYDRMERTGLKKGILFPDEIPHFAPDMPEPQFSLNEN